MQSRISFMVSLIIINPDGPVATRRCRILASLAARQAVGELRFGDTLGQ